MPTPLLTSKLAAPPRRPNLVTRTRLFERLTDGLDRKLTLISAPAGFGKSMLLAEWVACIDRPAAWLCLDPGDNDLPRFLSYLIAAVQAIDPSIGQEIVAQPPSPQATDLEGPLTVLVNDLSQTRSFAVVLDDYHYITAEPIHGVLAFLIEHLPANVHLAIAARADPPLPLARLRGRGQLTEVRAPDLQFTVEEAQAFFAETMQLQLDSDASAALQTRTEGWVAGLQLAGLSLQGREDVADFVSAFAGSHRYILDYLVEEVLSRQPEEVQAFLLRTSILSRLTGPLCDAVASMEGLADGHTMLARLESANLFTIALDDERRWFRYHHLFADALQSQLRHNRSDIVAELHRRAASWYAANAFPCDAVEHALLIGDSEYAAGLIETAALDVMARSEFATLRRWLEALPPAVLEEHPALCLYYGWIFVDFGDMDTARLWLERASDDKLPAYMRYLRAGIRATRSRLGGEPEQAAQIALEALAADAGSIPDADVPDSALRSFLTLYVAFQLAEALRVNGQLGQAIHMYRNTLPRVEHIDADMRLCAVRGIAEVMFSLMLYEQNDLAGAEQQLEHGSELVRRGRNLRSEAISDMVLSALRQAQGRTEDAIDAIDHAQRSAGRAGERQMILYVAAQRAQLACQQGDLAIVANWVREYEGRSGAGASMDKRLGYFQAFAERTYVRGLLALDRTDEALSRIEWLLEQTAADDQTSHVFELLVLQVMGLQKHSKNSQALDWLQRALVIGQSGGFIRIFVDAGAPVADLLRARGQDISGVATEYVDRLLQAWGEPIPTIASQSGLRERPAAAGLLVEPLTAREVEVLRLLEAGLHNRQIADQMVVSLGTVKRHTGNIYSKLGVDSRTQAIGQARRLGLL
jgi:LuxR family maltose regulon positive regulatory protein